MLRSVSGVLEERCVDDEDTVPLVRVKVKRCVVDRHSSTRSPTLVLR